AALDATRSFNGRTGIQQAVGPVQQELVRRDQGQQQGPSAADQAQAMAGKRMMGGIPVDAQGRMIYDPLAYRTAADSYHANARELAAQADAALPGHGLSAAVLDVANTHGATKP